MSATVVGYLMVGKPAVPAPPEVADPPSLGDCRHCGHPAFGQDERGPIHGCCIRAEAEGVPCGACAESRRAARRQR